MTALCGGGTSSAKTGFGASIALTASGIGALLNNIPTAWAVPLAAYIGLITYDLASFCSVDPPAVPTITAVDFISVLSIADPLNHILAVQKFQQLVGAFAWYQLCKCDSVATPAPPAPPAAPASVPTVNPGTVVGPNPGNVTCALVDAGDQVDPGGAASFAIGRTSGNATALGAIAPSGASTVRVTFTWTGTGAPVGWNLVSSTSDNYPTVTNRASGTPAWTSGVSQTTSFSGTLDSYWWFQFSGQPPTNQHYRAIFEFFCGGGAPGLPQPNCGCVPDANTIGLLSSIYQLLTTVQRYKVPFAYVQGATHSAVSGTGATPISRLVGVQMVVTAQPATKRTSLGNPSYIYDLGWVSVSDANGMIEEKRLTRTNLLWFPELAPVASSFNYFLQSGVTINWTELQAET